MIAYRKENFRTVIFQRTIKIRECFRCVHLAFSDWQLTPVTSGLYSTLIESLIITGTSPVFNIRDPSILVCCVKKCFVFWIYCGNLGIKSCRKHLLLISHWRNISSQTFHRTFLREIVYFFLKMSKFEYHDNTLKSNAF